MKVNIKDISLMEFLNYSDERQRKSNTLNNTYYPYINNHRLEKVFEFYQKKNIICSGANALITINGSFESKFSSPLPCWEQTEELYREELLALIWCKAEWICRGLNGFYRSTIESETSKKFCQELSKL